MLSLGDRSLAIVWSIAGIAAISLVYALYPVSYTHLTLPTNREV